MSSPLVKGKGLKLVSPFTRRLEPINRIVVDIGTGSGRWVVEVANAFPESYVIGTDISPIQSTDDVPENCEFIVMDLNDGLQFNDGSIDLVHSR
jgi:ubiquinone/menaquinone biosynthesis C-methylase UbiE